MSNNDLDANDILGSSAALKALQVATHGLLFPSESDKPIKAFLWKKATGESAAVPLSPAALKAFGVNVPDAVVTVLTMDSLFAPMTVDQSWFGPDEKATAQRFRDLAALPQRLNGVTAFRFSPSDHGEPVLIYVLGYTSDGDIAGITTEVVET